MTNYLRIFIVMLIVMYASIEAPLLYIVWRGDNTMGGVAGIMRGIYICPIMALIISFFVWRYEKSRK